MSSEYSTYEALLAAIPRTPAGFISIDFLRLHWSLKSDDQQSSITVLQDATDANSTQEPYSPAHPVAQASLTTPPISSIAVSVEILNDYRAEWIGVHREHAEPEDSPDHSGERYDAEGVIEYCCEQDRPGTGPRVEITAEPGHFVTIGRFIEIVHPWLRSLDGQLRAAKGVQNSWPLNADIPLCVWTSTLSPLRIAGRDGQTAENWAYEWTLLARTAATTQRLRHEAAA